MIIVLKPKASEADALRVVQMIEHQGLTPLYMPGIEQVVIGALGDELRTDQLTLDGDPAVESVKRIVTSYKLVSRELCGVDTLVSFGDVTIGGERVVLVGGPAAVESVEQLTRVASGLQASGFRVLSGGAFLAHRSPYAYRGLGAEALRMLRLASFECGLPVVSEVHDTSQFFVAASCVDGVQLGGSQLANVELLRLLAESEKPVILTRGPASSLQDLLLAAEAIVAAGNPRVVLCERGTRSPDGPGLTLDIAALAYLKQQTHLPVLVAPGAACQSRQGLAALAKAAVAGGADAVLLDVHEHERARSADAGQSLSLEEVSQLTEELRGVARAVGRDL